MITPLRTGTISEPLNSEQHNDNVKLSWHVSFDSRKPPQEHSAVMVIFLFFILASLPVSRVVHATRWDVLGGVKRGVALLWSVILPLQLRDVDLVRPELALQGRRYTLDGVLLQRRQPIARFRCWYLADRDNAQSFYSVKETSNYRPDDKWRCGAWYNEELEILVWGRGGGGGGRGMGHFSGLPMPSPTTVFLNSVIYSLSSTWWLKEERRQLKTKKKWACDQ